MPDETVTINTSGSEEEPIEPIKNTHTMIDEITENVIKVMLVAFVMAGIGYFTLNYMGKDKGVDPNLGWGFFTGVALTIVPVYFIARQRKNKDNEKPN